MVYVSAKLDFFSFLSAITKQHRATGTNKTQSRGMVGSGLTSESNCAYQRRRSVGLRIVCSTCGNFNVRRNINTRLYVFRWERWLRKMEARRPNQGHWARRSSKSRSRKLFNMSQLLNLIKCEYSTRLVLEDAHDKCG